MINLESKEEMEVVKELTKEFAYEGSDPDDEYEDLEEVMFRLLEDEEDYVDGVMAIASKRGYKVQWEDEMTFGLYK